MVEMSPILVYLILVLAVLIVIGILLLVWIARHPERRMNGTEYKAFFVIGLGYAIAATVLSLIFPDAFGDFLFFLAIGIVFMGVGLGNIRKWKGKG